MEDDRNSVLLYSERVLSKLKLLSVFFGEPLLLRIYARTQVIHNSFRDNAQLDVQKLGLFHLQFTDTIVSLLRKIKKGNENRVLQIEDEMRVNAELIHTLASASQREQAFATGAQGHALAIDKGLNILYENLSDRSRDNPFPKVVGEFAATFAADFFYEVSLSFFDSLLEHDPARLYRNGYGSIERKLMGLQCKHGFQNTFHCGIKSGRRVAEVFRISNFIVEDDDFEYFVFEPERKLFLSLGPEKVAAIPQEGSTAKTVQTIFALQEVNVQLERRLPVIRTELPKSAPELLADYLRRIEAIDFLDMIDKFDIQANILKTMLRTEI